MSATFYELLKYAKTGIASPEMTHYDKLKALAMCKGGFPVSTITGIPPISFKADGTPLTAWSISGNMVQSSVPSPNNPVQPQETGDRTANLFDKNKTAGQIYVTDSAQRYGIEIPVAAGTYTISGGTPRSFAKIKISDTYGTAIALNIVKTFELGSDGFILVYAAYQADYDEAKSGIMLNTGSTALDYEPFGYKLPLTIAGQTQTVYLDEPLRKIGDYADVASAVGTVGTVTRAVLCHVFDGTETGIYKNNQEADNYLYYVQLFASGWNLAKIGTQCVCSHLPLSSDTPVISIGIRLRQDTGRILYLNFGADIMSAQTSGNTVNGLKEYLSAQYAAGTPVTVWYVMETAQTETVTVPTLTPTKGSNTLSVGTTLQPSEVSITGHIQAAT